MVPELTVLASPEEVLPPVRVQKLDAVQLPVVFAGVLLPVSPLEEEVAVASLPLLALHRR